MIEIQAFAAPIVSLIAGTLILALAAYYVRLTYLSDRLRIRMEARLSERERIARELHDTVLQGFQGLVLRFQAAVEEIQPSNAARKPLEDALDLADKVLSEGRNRVIDLRASDDADDILQLTLVAAKRFMGQTTATIIVKTDGTPRQLNSLVREEVLRIIQEAFANAARHADADVIDACITYLPRELNVRIRDNGVGFDPAILARGGPRNHFGMIGMRERADRINGVCNITSGPGLGTQIILSVPASTAYHQHSDRLWGRLRGTHALAA
jgi:signal transduction histidine kinase